MPMACALTAASADTERARGRILVAGTKAEGYRYGTVCTIGLGVPTPRWAEAVTMGIAAVAELGGHDHLLDADVTLLAGQTTAVRIRPGRGRACSRQSHRVTSALEEKASTEVGPAELPPTLRRDGRVELGPSGAMALQRRAVDTFAQGGFGRAADPTATRVDEALPEGWPARVLAGLEALPPGADAARLPRSADRGSKSRA